MASQPKSAGIEPNVSRNAAYSALAKTLRLSVGRGCRFSYKDLERKSGVPSRMIEAYRYEPDHEEWRPAPFEHILSLVGAIGTEAANDFLALVGMVSIWLPDDIDHDKVEEACRGYLSAKGDAHKEDSPARRDISDCENARLNVKIVELRRAVAA
jgi:hypothetical protein